ncbi:MAG: hypothetical protein JWP91_3371 [Fibrobacteres bacterium]|nr:hypothetical protein [Fibrobacterota bacterium]
MDAKATLNIFEYLDYRKLLADYYSFKKSLNRHFSHRMFALKAGIRSSGYFSEVLNGRRNLAKAQIQKFAKAMDLGAKERVYFELMVGFCHAKSDAARKSIYGLMLEAMPVNVQQVKQSQMEYFAKWYHVAVRETLSIVAVKGEGEELAGVLDPPISPAQAKAAIRLLERLRLVARDAEGCWRATHVSLLSPGDPGAAMLLREFQREMMLRAADALERVPSAQRDVSCVTMSVSADGLARIKGLAAEFHKRVLEVVRSDRGEDRVIQLNVQVFPLTRGEGPALPRSEDGHALHQN